MLQLNKLARLLLIKLFSLAYFLWERLVAWRYGTQHNDAQHNETQHNDIQHNDIQRNDTQHNDTQDNDSYSECHVC